MEQHKTLSVGEILEDYLHGTDFEKQFQEHIAMEKWSEVMGSQVAALTGKMEVKNGILLVHILSAGLRAQLFELRFDIVKRLNEAAGCSIIKDIRLLG